MAVSHSRVALQWPIDQQTVRAATDYQLAIKGNVPASQFGGCLTSAETWNDRVVQPSTWPDTPLWSSPDEIIKQFTDERYTQGLALVVSWGGMGRRSKDIYCERKRETIEQIERTLRCCAHSIRELKSIAIPWRMLTGSEPGQLGSSGRSLAYLHQGPWDLGTQRLFCQAVNFLAGQPRSPRAHRDF